MSQRRLSRRIAVSIIVSFLFASCVSKLVHVAQCDHDRFATDTYESKPELATTVVDPWRRLKHFEHCREEAHNYKPVGGMSGMYHPNVKALRTSEAYLRIGRDFESSEDRGAAARAYWAALALAWQARAARADRERVRQAAFEGLARLAKSRGQTNWAGLLTVCADLVSAYLKAPAADAEKREFLAAYRQLKSAEDAAYRAKKAAESAARKQTGCAIFGALASIGGAVASGRQISRTQEAAILGSVKATLDRVSAQENKANAAFTAVLGKIDSAVRQLSTATADDVPEVRAGKSFFAEQVIFYLAAASDPAPYLEVLRRAARANEWQELEAIVLPLKGLPKLPDAALTGLRDALKSIEINAVLVERARLSGAELANLRPPPVVVPAPAPASVASAATTPPPTPPVTPAPALPPRVNPHAENLWLPRVEELSAQAQATPNIEAKIERASAMALSRAGRDDDALATLDRIVARQPDWLAVRVSRATLHVALANKGAPTAPSTTAHLAAAADDLTYYIERAPTAPHRPRVLRTIGQLRAYVAMAGNSTPAPSTAGPVAQAVGPTAPATPAQPSSPGTHADDLWWPRPPAALVGAPAVALDVESRIQRSTAGSLLEARRFEEAEAALTQLVAKHPGWLEPLVLRAFARAALARSGAAHPTRRAALLQSAADDLTAYVKGHPNAPDRARVLETIGQLRARAALANEPTPPTK